MVIKEQTRGPGHAINGSVAPGRGMLNQADKRWRAQNPKDPSGSPRYACLWFQQENREELQPQEMGASNYKMLTP